MASDKANEDDVLLVTCTFCGTQTRVNTRAVEADRAVPCRECGAPLKIELPDSWERRVRERSRLVNCENCGALTEMRNTYYVKGMRYCARCNELSHVERRKRQEETIGIIVSLGIILAFTVLMFFAERC